jgi:hypothetical protein
MIISNCTNQEKYEINEILNENDEQMNHNQNTNSNDSQWPEHESNHNSPLYNLLCNFYHVNVFTITIKI